MWVAIGLPIIVLVGFVLYPSIFSPDGAAALSWTAPSEDEKSEPLTDLAGYKIHCWAAARQYSTTIHVDDPATTSLVIEKLPHGSYNCAISAVNSSGRESALSNVIAMAVK